MAPYKLGGNETNWLSVRRKEEEAQRRLRLLEDYAPGIRDEMLWTTVSTPAETASRFAMLKERPPGQRASRSLRMDPFRLNEECSDIRTPVPGLYMGGPSSHAGGLIDLGPGYLAAGAVADDLGLKKWWATPG